ncbi:hypothetical protein V6N11_030550 [Hibiscus sabdariffa]|uniref:Uncharacterized protein n=1 Tax=Hibiscus sabdariffa TaxID=183260 RepID=A0ABR2N7C8_9ROSI
MGMGAGTSTGTIAGPGTSTGMVTGKVWDVVLALPAGREEEKGPSKKKTKFEAGSSRGNKEGTSSRGLEWEITKIPLKGKETGIFRREGKGEANSVKRLFDL